MFKRSRAAYQTALNERRYFGVSGDIYMKCEPNGYISISISRLSIADAIAYAITGSSYFGGRNLDRL